MSIISRLSAETDQWMREQGLAKDVYPYEWDEHFAKLIVQECVAFLTDEIDDHFAAEQLADHFGVE